MMWYTHTHSHKIHRKSRKWFKSDRGGANKLINNFIHICLKFPSFYSSISPNQIHLYIKTLCEWHKFQYVAHIIQTHNMCVGRFFLSSPFLFWHVNCINQKNQNNLVKKKNPRLIAFASLTLPFKHELKIRFLSARESFSIFLFKFLANSHKSLI